MSKMYERVRCEDGYSVSVQAGDGKYCHPRDDYGPYSAVELGFPSQADPMLDGYAEERHKPTDTVYPYVPVGLVRDLIVKHGGALTGEVPPGVTLLYSPCREKEDK